jgi:poly(3-hydroxybutyrate) depolymerase
MLDTVGRGVALAMAFACAACGGGGEATEDETKKPVSGCGKAAVGGDRALAIAGFEGRYYISLPAGYDPSTRYPLGFAFHGDGRNHFDCRDPDCYEFQGVIGPHAVLVYMQSLREPPDAGETGWGDARDDNVAFFEATLDALTAELCIDEQRVFVAGTSSGAIFANVLGCRLGDRLLAVAPIAGSTPETEQCTGTPAALVVHGVDDPHVTFESGQAARDFYAARNGCSPSTEPPIATVHDEIRAKRDAQPTVEATACVEYTDCSSAPVRWCEHSYGGYDDSTHGWPFDGAQLIWDFVQELD